MVLANEKAQTSAYQYYITVSLSVSLCKLSEAPVVTLHLFVCLSVAMTTSQGSFFFIMVVYFVFFTICNGWNRLYLCAE